MIAARQRMGGRGEKREEGKVARIPRNAFGPRPCGGMRGREGGDSKDMREEKTEGRSVMTNDSATCV